MFEAPRRQQGPDSKSCLNFSCQNGFQDVAMTVRLILRAMAKERDWHPLSQSLKQSEGKFLAMIFYDRVSPVYRR